MEGDNEDKPKPAPMSIEDFMTGLAKENDISMKRIDEITRAVDKANVPMMNIGQFLQDICVKPNELCYMSLRFGIFFGMRVRQPGV